MLKWLMVLLGIYLRISEILPTRQRSNGTKAVANVLDQFHQSDYKLEFEYAQVVRTNKSYGDYKMIAFKYNRTCVAVNATFTAAVNIGYDMEAVFQLHKFASNEYRVFPIRLQFNFCEAISKNVLGYKRILQCGNFSCPVLKGKRYHFCHFAPDESMLPPLIPSGRYMLEIQAIYHAQEMFLERHYATISRPIKIN